MKKGITLEQIHSTVKLIKKYNIIIFAFFLIGFEWENRNHLNLTRKLIFELNADFIEISVVVPFINSEIYNSKFDNYILGKDSYKNILSSSSYISKEELEQFRKDVIFSYHFRFSYIMKKLFRKKISWDLFKNYVKYAIRILKNK